MAIAARRPAPPPPTSTMSGDEVTARGRGAGDEGSAMLGDELVHQDGAVVADQFSAHAAIVVLVPHAPAAAGVVPAVTDQALFVLVLAVLPVGHPSTGSPFALEARGRGNHRSPSVALWAGGPTASPRDRSDVCVRTYGSVVDSQHLSRRGVKS